MFYTSFCFAIDNIKAVHNLGSRNTLAGAVVKRRYGYSGGFVHTAAHVLAGIGRAAETVFGRKKGYYIKPVNQAQVYGATSLLT